MTNSKMQLHVSGLLLHEDCGVAFERRVLRGERYPPASYLHVGSAVHETARANLTNIKERKAPLVKMEVVQIARDTVVGRWNREGVTLTDEEVEAGAKKTQGAAIDKSVALAELHYDKVAPHIEPIEVERPFVLDVAGYDFQIAGTIDTQEREGIRDTKTSKRSPSEGEAEKSLQLLSYALAVKVLDGKAPKTGTLDHLVQTPKRKDTYHVPDSTSFVGVDFSPFLNRVQVAYEAIRKGSFIPASPSGPRGWRCSAKFCEFFPTCRYALRPVSIPLVQIGPIQEGK